MFYSYTTYLCDEPSFIQFWMKCRKLVYQFYCLFLCEVASISKVYFVWHSCPLSIATGWGSDSIHLPSLDAGPPSQVRINVYCHCLPLRSI